MIGITLNKSELRSIVQETLVDSAFEYAKSQGLSNENAREFIENNSKVIMAEIVDNAYRRNLTSVRPSNNDAPEQAIAIFKDAKDELEIQRIQMEAYFWSKFNSFYRNNMFKEAREFTLTLPECSARMKAIITLDNADKGIIE